jgi:hypothetical protein
MLTTSPVRVQRERGAELRLARRCRGRLQTPSVRVLTREPQRNRPPLGLLLLCAREEAIDTVY